MLAGYAGKGEVEERGAGEKEGGGVLPRMRKVVREFDLMTRYRVGPAVEDDEAGGGRSLVYAADEPLI